MAQVPITPHATVPHHSSPKSIRAELPPQELRVTLSPSTPGQGTPSPHPSCLPSPLLQQIHRKQKTGGVDWRSDSDSDHLQGGSGGLPPMCTAGRASPCRCKGSGPRAAHCPRFPRSASLVAVSLRQEREGVPWPVGQEPPTHGQRSAGSPGGQEQWAALSAPAELSGSFSRAAEPHCSARPPPVTPSTHGDSNRGKARSGQEAPSCCCSPRGM